MSEKIIQDIINKHADQPREATWSKRHRQLEYWTSRNTTGFEHVTSKSQAQKIIDKTGIEQTLKVVASKDVWAGVKATDYGKIRLLLLNLKQGDKVKVEYPSSQHGGANTRKFVITHSNQDIKDSEHPLKGPAVYMSAGKKDNRGRKNLALLMDYGKNSGIMFQPTMNTQVIKVISLERE